MKKFSLITGIAAILAAVLCLCGLFASCGSAGQGTETEESSFKSETEKETQTMGETPSDTASQDTAIYNEPIKFSVGSYNIKHAADGGCEVIGKVIADSGVDICGVQEVDYLNTRSNSENQPKLIASAAGMPYYRFARSIDYKGGQYGTAIFSKFPIESYEVIQLDAGTEEGRSVAHAVLDVNGVKVDFFNTHLSYEEKSLRDGQFAAIAKLFAGCEYYILTGDFNTEDFTEFEALGDVQLINSTETRYVTFPKSSKAIDNIVSSKNMTATFGQVITDSHSDHYMLTADFRIVPGK